MKKGLFIILEGPDGSGKTTVATALCQLLEQQGISTVHTREPGGVAIAEDIRKIILDPKNTAMDPMTEVLLYAASRRQHLTEKVVPALKEGKIVICERFVYSSLAYQGSGRQIGFEPVLTINEYAVGDCKPDCTLYLDVPEELGLSRVESRGNKDRLDGESLAFHQRVNAGYKEVLRRFGDATEIIDASKPLEEVIDKALNIVLAKING